MNELTTPPTEIEIAELVFASQKVLTPAGIMILRRILFERDSLVRRLVGCPWEQDLETTLCPKHGKTLLECPVGGGTVSVDCTPVAAATIFVSR